MNNHWLKLIADDKTENVLDELERLIHENQLFENDWSHTIIIQKSQLTRINTLQLRGAIKEDEYNLEKNRINTAVTKLLKNLIKDKTFISLVNALEINVETARKIMDSFVDTLLKTTKRNVELKSEKIIRVEGGNSKLTGKKYYQGVISDGKGVIILHADGYLAKNAFYVRKGIAYYYMTNFSQIDENLGLPISNEHMCGSAGKNAKTDFENGFIEWINDENALYIYKKGGGAVKLLAEYKFN